MRGRRRIRREDAGRWALLALACLVALAAPSAVLAENPLYLPEEQQQMWAQRLAEAQQEIDQARARVEQLQAAYSRARHSDHPRGEDREELEAKLRAAENELERAQQRLPDLVEEARRAGVYPQVLRPYQGD